MPTKLNKAGKQQPYVPPGQGDASGEYADNEFGSNIHYSSPERQEQAKHKSATKPQSERVAPPESEKQTSKGEQSSNINKNSIDYTRTLAGDVKISKGSLSNEEIGFLNSSIEKMYNDYPEMKRFAKITVDNRTASNKGGYIRRVGRTRLNANGRFEKMYDYELYINSSWGEVGREYRHDLEKYEKILQDVKRNPTKYRENAQNTVKSHIEWLKGKIESAKQGKTGIVSTVTDKFVDRNARLKSVIDHELFHRIVENNIGYMNDYVGANGNPLRDEVREVYRKAIENGDAKNISSYAAWDMDEFLAEAGAQIAQGIETPKYISDLIDKIRRVKK